MIPLDRNVPRLILSRPLLFRTSVADRCE